MKKPVISVVIPAFNEEKYLGRALKSLQEQNFPNFEVIVADNGSTDKTAAIAKKFGAKVVRETRKGVAYARQAGFLKAEGEIIATTDADTILPTVWLKNIYQAFSKNPQAVGISGFFDFYDSGRIFRVLFFFISRAFFLLTNSYPGVNLAIKKKAFKKIGGFNLDYVMGEDTEICLRLKKIGRVIRNYSNPVQTSVRRYQKTGALGTTWDYLSLYFRIRTKIGPIPVFEAASTLKNMNFRKALDYLFLLLVILFIFGKIHSSLP